MNHLVSVLSPQSIVLDLEVNSKKRIFEEVGEWLTVQCGVLAQDVFESLFAREQLGSTALGHGVAIPHGRLGDLNRAVGYLVRLKSPIPFDAPDDLPVDLLFVLLVPKNATEVHLQVLSSLAHFFSSKEHRDWLRQAHDVPSVYERLSSM